MIKVQKQFYDAPSTMVLEVKQEGAICVVSDVKSGNSIKNWEDGGTTNDEVFM